MEEVRVGGVLRYVRVTPRHGRSYYLVPTSDGQNFTRQDSHWFRLERSDVAVVFLVT